MLFFFIMPGVMSGLGNLLVPIQLGVPELMFPKVNNIGAVATTTKSIRWHDHAVYHMHTSGIASRTPPTSG
jgi:heme/copper-type cytochrome/quinol oxidase subunit 1